MAIDTSLIASEDTGVIEWRIGLLRHAGFEPFLASRLARDRRIDLHAVLELVDRGCPPHLAARILRPLDDLADAEDGS
jgi:hypothetical protein